MERREEETHTQTDLVRSQASHGVSKPLFGQEENLKQALHPLNAGY